jgi:hypothetical protein
MDDEEEDNEHKEDEFVVDKLTEICYGGDDRENCIYFKVPYGPFCSFPVRALLLFKLFNYFI